MKTIQMAGSSIDSRPCDQDPGGHWGLETNGFQVSLRFEKNMFTNGEPIVACTLIRNVTGHPQSYFRPVHIVVKKDGKPLNIRNTDYINLSEIHLFPEITVFPQTQRRDVQDLNKIYEFSENGEYLVQAVSGRPQVASQTVGIFVTSTTTNK